MKSPFKSNFLIPIKEYEKKLIAYFKKISAETEKEGKDDSVSPPPEATKLSQIPTISAKENSCRSILADCNTRLKGNLDVALSNYDQSYNKLGGILEQSQGKIDVLQAQKEQALSAVVSATKKKEALLVKGIEDKTTRLKGFMKELKENKRISVVWQCVIAIAFNVAFMAGDTAYVAKAFSLVGLSRMEQLAIALVLGLATGLIGAGVVEAFRAKWNTLQRYGVVVVLVAMVVIGYMVVGQLRVDLLAKSSVEGVALSELSALEFAFINVLIFSAVIIVHALAWPNKAKWEKYRDYKNAKAEVKEIEKEIKADEKSLGNLPKELEQKQARVSKKFNQQIKALEKIQQDAINQTEEAQTTYNNIFGCCTEFYHQINTFFRSEVGHYVSIMNKYRNDDYYMVMDDSISDLPNPFEKYQYAEDELPQILSNEESALADVNINFDELLTPKNENYENLFEKTSLSLVLVICMGCELPEHEAIEIIIADDITDSNLATGMDMSTADVIELFGLEANPFNYGKVRVSSLSDVSLNKTYQAKLEPVTSMLEYQELFREAEIKAFVSQIDSLLHSANSIERGKKSSSLLRPMHQELMRLSQTVASKKYAIFYTDLQEHSNIFSSYSKPDMQFLLDHPEEFTERVLSNAPLPDDMNGIDIYIISNQQEENVYHQALRDWYYEIITSRGARLSISANLVLD